MSVCVLVSTLAGCMHVYSHVMKISVLIFVFVCMCVRVCVYVCTCWCVCVLRPSLLQCALQYVLPCVAMQHVDYTRCVRTHIHAHA